MSKQFNEQTISQKINFLKENVNSEFAAEKITKKFPHISVISARKIIEDVKDNISGKMSEPELQYYLAEYGIA